MDYEALSLGSSQAIDELYGMNIGKIIMPNLKIKLKLNWISHHNGLKAR